jgi:hypothetical protein
MSAVLATGATIALPATTAAEEPDLAGTVIHDAVIPFQVTDPSHTKVLCEGQLQDRAVRSTATHDLHFYYRLIGTPSRVRFPNRRLPDRRTRDRGARDRAASLRRYHLVCVRQRRHAVQQ